MHGLAERVACRFKARPEWTRGRASLLDESVRGLGASEVVDTRSPRLAEFARCADVVIDTVGGESQRSLFGRKNLLDSDHIATGERLNLLDWNL